MKDTNNMRKQRKYFHYIYKIHFLCGYPSGRYYIGKRTYYGPSIENDKYTGSGTFCFAYFKKYGKVAGETYIKEILEINPSVEVNSDREKYLIDDLWETDSLCMNQKPGGDGGAIKGHFVSKETKRKIGDAHKGNKFWLGKKHSEESKEKDRIAHLGNKYGLGHTVSEEQKQKTSTLFSKSVCQYDILGNFIAEYTSAIEAAKETNGCRSKITSCCNRKRKSSGGYIWRFKNDPLTEIDIKNTIPKNYKKVVQLDYNGNVLNEYPTLKKAGKAINGHWQNIQDVCNNKQKTAYGFVWIFKND